MGNTAECFEAEVKSKLASGRSIKPSSIPRNEELPRLYLMLKGDGTKTKREINLENDIKAQNKKYQQILQAGRQIFSVSINLLQILHQFREVTNRADKLNNFTLPLFGRTRTLTRHWRTTRSS